MDPPVHTEPATNDTEPATNDMELKATRFEIADHVATVWLHGRTGTTR